MLNKYLKIILVGIVFNIQLHSSLGHNHPYETWTNQWKKMWTWGAMFEKELEMAERGKNYNFSEILKEENRLANELICPSCQKAYRSLCDYQEVRIEEVKRKLETRELPRIDNERGHHA